MTDPDRFLALLEGVRQALEILKRYRVEVERQRLLRDVDTQNMVSFAMYRAVQGCIDLGQHVIAERGLPVPSAYREVFRVLGEASVIDGPLTGRLDGWGGFRNVIADQYGKVDYELVARALYEELDDLEAFLRAMAKLAREETRR